MPFVSAGANGFDRSPFKNWIHKVFIKSLKNSAILSTGASEMSQEKNFASTKLQLHGKIKKIKNGLLVTWSNS